ncbi:MAG: ribbon-helix-helix protein, CopG family [candidate division NC10 bacterium]|nr:ribbon-helix-helix protein, CopG family [candidate division NC10 bacterium]
MKRKLKLPEFSKWTDAQREAFWEKHQPEEFSGWEKTATQFVRAPRKLIQARLDPADARALDRVASRTGIDRSQLVRAWVKEKLRKVAQPR